MKILNLYAGLGGNRKFWHDCEVTAVEINERVAEVYANQYPEDELIIGDAHSFLLDHHREFDFIWSSPPCQTHSQLHLINSSKHKYDRYPDMSLYQEIIFLQTRGECDWLVENVKPHYKPLIPGHAIGRHLFWSSFHLPKFPELRIKDIYLAKPKEIQSRLKAELGVHYDGNIYLPGSHDPCQALRNCVHPQIGLFIYQTLIESRRDLFSHG